MAGAVTRRRTALAVLALCALTACPSPAPEPQRTSASKPPSPTAPPTGEIRVGYPSEPPTLNPYLTGSPA
ncbi:MAG: hypothetical protein ACRDJM_07450, partial [Actinomycetota bacterium]